MSRVAEFAYDEDARTVTLAQQIPAPDDAFLEAPLHEGRHEAGRIDVMQRQGFRQRR